MIKVNLHDKCSANGKFHKPSCWVSGVHGKYPKNVQVVTDGSGDVDIYTEDQLESLYCYSGIKIGWIKENEAIKPGPFHDLRSHYHFYFNDLNFRYIYTYDEKLIKLHPKFKYSVGEGFWVDPYINVKTKLVSMIVSNKIMTPYHVERLKVMHRYKDKVDVFGRGWNEIETKEEGLNDYMFSFAMENDVVDTMMSEKLFDCFAMGTVPIYLGSKKAGEYFNPDGIIFFDENFDINMLSEDLYQEKASAIIDNFQTVQQYEIPIDYIFQEVYDEIQNASR